MFTPEGQIESAGHFTRGLGPRRIGWIRRGFGIGAAVLIAVGLVGLLASR